MEFLYVDTETDGLQWWAGKKPFLVGTGISNNPISVLGSSSMKHEQLIGKTSSHLIGDYSKSDKPGNQTYFVAHNAPFDLHMLREMGFHFNGPIEDTMHLAHLLGYEKLSLEALAKSVLHIERTNGPWEWMKKNAKERGLTAKDWREQRGYIDVPKEIIEPYLIDDVSDVRAIHQKLRPIVMRMCPEQYQVECDLIPVMVQMELNGMKVDRGYLEKKILESRVKLSELESKLQDMTWEGFNPRSPKQVSRMLFENLKLPVLDYTDKDNPTTDSVTLYKYNVPFTRAMIEYRKLKIIDSTFYRGLYDRSTEEGILHPNTRQNGAKTGRFSCSNPNVENIPRRDKSVRKAFIPRTGHSLLFADYAQIEIRGYAHYANDRDLINAIVNGLDFHTDTAMHIFGKTNDSLRSDAKTAAFQSIYACGAKKLGWSLTRMRMQESEEHRVYETKEAKFILDGFHKRRPSVKRMIKDVGQDIKSNGFTTDVYGRRYYGDPNFSYRGLNYLVQGTAAQVMKRAMLRVTDMIREKNVPMKIINVVHDELIFEIETGYLNEHQSELCGQLREAMEDRETFRLPLTIDIARSDKSWADKEQIDEPRKSD